MNRPRRGATWGALGLLVSALALGASCATLAEGPAEGPPASVAAVVPLAPLNPLLFSRTDLEVGPYTLTPFERRVLREIFGPPVVRWVERHVRVAPEAEFTGSQARTSAYYENQTRTITLRQDSNAQDSRRLATLVHETTHYWEATQYRHFRPVAVTAASPTPGAPGGCTPPGRPKPTRTSGRWPRAPKRRGPWP